MQRRIVLAFFLVSLTTHAALAQVWKTTSASVTFKAKMFGTTIEGTFMGFSGQLQFDPATGTGNLTATVDTRTVDTGNTLRNRHLRERETFFNAEKFPVIRMKSTRLETRLEKTATGYAGTFNLTVKNTTRPVRVPFTFTTEGTKGTFTGTFSINRKDFNFGGNTLGMSETVTISLLVNTVITPAQ